jgi:hypothetical protein
MSVEDRMNAQKRKLEEKIADLRGSTMRYAHLGSDGLEITDADAVAAINSQVDDLEAKISTIDDALSEIAGIYESVGVQSFQELNEKGAQAQNDLENGAIQCWDAFVLYRGEGSYDSRNRTRVLPSDLAAMPEFKTQEDASRAKIEAAAISYPLLCSARDRINILTQQLANL